jgi:hypothetical protein
MKHLQLYEDWGTDTIKYDTMDKDKVEKLSNLLNSYTPRDMRISNDRWDNDRWDAIRNQIIDFLNDEDVNKEEMEETILYLDKNGAFVLSEFLLTWIKNNDIKMIDVKSLKDTLEIRKNDITENDNQI